jgi:hypothetical protein
LVKPDCIHITGSGVGGYRCDYELQGSWDEKYMEDEVARLLPICENCLASYTDDYGPEAAEILQDRLLNPENYLTEIPRGREPPSVDLETEPSQDFDDEPLSWPSEVPVMTLREYLTM